MSRGALRGEGALGGGGSWRCYEKKWLALLAGWRGVRHARLHLVG